MLPLARKDNLLIHELGTETLIYDLENHRAHCLNASAAWVMRQCDGHTTPEAIAKRLAETFEVVEAADEAVQVALEALRDAALLPPEPKAPVERVSRRELARKARRLGVAALVPAITSILAPTAAEAASGLPDGTSCSRGGEPCRGGCCCGSGNHGTCTNSFICAYYGGKCV